MVYGINTFFEFADGKGAYSPQILGSQSGSGSTAEGNIQGSAGAKVILLYTQIERLVASVGYSSYGIRSLFFIGFILSILSGSIPMEGKSGLAYSCLTLGKNQLRYLSIGDILLTDYNLGLYLIRGSRLTYLEGSLGADQDFPTGAQHFIDKGIGTTCIFRGVDIDFAIGRHENHPCLIHDTHL